MSDTDASWLTSLVQPQLPFREIFLNQWAESIEAIDCNSDQLAARLRSKTSAAGGGLLLLSGKHCDALPQIAADFASQVRGTWLLAAGVGVLCGPQEWEGSAAAVGLCLKQAPRVLLGDRADESFGRGIQADWETHGPANTLVLIRGDQAEDGWQTFLSATKEPIDNLFGGGSLPGVQLARVSAGVVEFGPAAALFFGGSPFLRIRSSAAARLLTPLLSAGQVRAGRLGTLDGMPALDRLREATAQLGERALVLLAVGAQDGALEKGARRICLQPIVGVDPAAGSLVTTGQLREGMRLALAVRDADASQADLSEQLRSLRRESRGTTPDFALFLSCAGRGQSLYGQEHVDARLIRSHFPGLPLIGIHSTFELAPLDGELRTCVYSGVLALFSRPS